jgi:hypothetical protein
VSAVPRALARLPGGLELEVGGGIAPPVSWSSGRLRVSWEALEADASWGVLGERVASLLLVEPESVEGDKGRLESIAERYRERVAREESVGLAALLGELAREVRADPLILPVSRMRSVSANTCVFNAALEEPEGLSRLWRAVAEKLDMLSGGSLDLDAALRYRSYKPVIGEAVRRAAEKLASLTSSWPTELSSCSPKGVLRETWRLIEAPEGLVAPYACREVEGLVSECSCRRPTPISSSVVCDCGGETLTLKRYGSAMYKWFLAAPLAARYGFRVSPTARARAEYSWFRRIRGAVETPRTVALCLEPRRASAVRTFIPGKPLSEVDSVEGWMEGGRVLARIHHDAGASLGDSNPGNLLVEPPGLVDAEQARQYTPWRAAWDLAVAVSYAMVLMGKPSRLAEAFIEGYLDEAPRGEAAKIMETLSSPGFLVLSPTPPHAALLLRRAARRHGI